MAEANWYADPDDPSRLRYWDGAAWTDHTQDAPGAPMSAFDAAARGVQIRTDCGATGTTVTVVHDSNSAASRAGARAIAALRSLVGALIAAALVGALWFGINRFIADVGYLVFGLVSVVPAVCLGAVIGFFASDRREHPGWLASMLATVLGAATFAIATNGAIAGYFSGPDGVLLSCFAASMCAGIVAYAGRAREVSPWLIALNWLTCAIVSLVVLVVIFAMEVNPIGNPGGSRYEDCRLLREFAVSLDDGSQRRVERDWKAFSSYVNNEMSGRKARELRDRMAVHVLALAVDPDDAGARRRLDEEIDRYSDRFDC